MLAGFIGNGLETVLMEAGFSGFDWKTVESTVDAIAGNGESWVPVSIGGGLGLASGFES